MNLGGKVGSGEDLGEKLVDLPNGRHVDELGGIILTRVNARREETRSNNRVELLVPDLVVRRIHQAGMHALVVLEHGTVKRH